MRARAPACAGRGGFEESCLSGICTLACQVQQRKAPLTLFSSASPCHSLPASSVRSFSSRTQSSSLLSFLGTRTAVRRRSVSLVFLLAFLPPPLQSLTASLAGLAAHEAPRGPASGDNFLSSLFVEKEGSTQPSNGAFSRENEKVGFFSGNGATESSLPGVSAAKGGGAAAETESAKATRQRGVIKEKKFEQLLEHKAEDADERPEDDSVLEKVGTATVWRKTDSDAFPVPPDGSRWYARPNGGAGKETLEGAETRTREKGQENELEREDALVTTATSSLPAPAEQIPKTASAWTPKNSRPATSWPASEMQRLANVPHSWPLRHPRGASTRAGERNETTSSLLSYGSSSEAGRGPSARQKSNEESGGSRRSSEGPIQFLPTGFSSPTLDSSPVSPPSSPSLDSSPVSPPSAPSLDSSPVSPPSAPSLDSSPVSPPSAPSLDSSPVSPPSAPSLDSSPVSPSSSPSLDSSPVSPSSSARLTSSSPALVGSRERRRGDVVVPATREEVGGVPEVGDSAAVEAGTPTLANPRSDAFPETGGSLSPQRLSHLPESSSSSVPSSVPAFSTALSGESEDWSLPPTLCFVVGILVSLVGTLLSALGDVCIRYSFVRNTPEAAGHVPPSAEARHGSPPSGEAESLTVLPLPPTSDILTDPPSSRSFPSSSVSLPTPAFPLNLSTLRRGRHREGECLSQALLPVYPVVHTANSDRADLVSPRAGRPAGIFLPPGSDAAGSRFSCSPCEEAPVEAPASLEGDEAAACTPWTAGWDPLWVFGVFCSCVVSPLLSIVSLSLLPANITGFGALQILFVVLLARFMLDEVVDKINLTGGVFVVTGLVTITVCAAPEPPLPDTATLARQLSTPSAIVYESVCLTVVAAGVTLLLLYKRPWRPEGATVGVAVEASLSASLLPESRREEPLDSSPRSSRSSQSRTGGENAALGSQGAQTPPAMGGRRRRRSVASVHTPRGHGRGSDKGLLNSSPTAVGDDHSGFASLGDGEEEADLCSSRSESDAGDSSAFFCGSLPLWHHALLPASGGVLGAVASISIKLIQAFFLSFSSACIPPSSSSPAAVWPVIGMLVCLLNPVFLFQHPWLPFLFLVVASAALLELLFLSQSLRHYPASESVPIMNSTLTVFMGVGGVIIFDEPPANPLGWATGLALLVLGVVVLGFGGKIWKCVHKAVRAGRRVWVRRPPRSGIPGTPWTGLPLGTQASRLRFGEANSRRSYETSSEAIVSEGDSHPRPWWRGDQSGESPVARWLRSGSGDIPSRIASGDRQRQFREEHRSPAERVAQRDGQSGEGGRERMPVFGGLFSWLTKDESNQRRSGVYRPETRRASEAARLRGISDFQAVVEDGEGWGKQGRCSHQSRRSSAGTDSVIIGKT
ncbi:conserved hypothetical protein [Neospora caninum Liverpool]|uniref:Magnesium transporter NIPA n=1 Tax=Neospora caninum (strain Liverpool) TaxID=572307 RepID=F0VK39_NEOCL|nr:conserved hypothetical protein [Neospora caninum Liverpool]CBZ54440.1 conserved hypothetical protein [Neospora caninum Liverpool]|eukprot:XP_003884470.1 conserved hypothetical protein [Neospora caninum Liverpool]